VYVQAGLHADEIPGMLAAHHLRERLSALEEEGRIAGEIVLVPSANPIGLSQRVLGSAVGRFDLSDGVNFNRSYPYLAPGLAERVEGWLTGDAGANVRTVREALRHELSGWRAATPAEALKKTLVGLAIESDVVLDLHCDSEAVVHLYTTTASAQAFEPLSALLGAEAVLLADESGDHPFDEACSRPWHELRERFPEHPVPQACHATTLELRGETDVDHSLAGRDAQAILGFLVLQGAIVGERPSVPPARCRPTPLSGSEPVVAPVAGIVVFRAKVGDRVRSGDAVAEIVDPSSGAVTPVRAQSDGIVYARVLARFAGAGQRIAKIAGTTLQRKGNLLSA
jgi:predicted deacylase